MSKYRVEKQQDLVPKEGLWGCTWRCPQRGELRKLTYKSNATPALALVHHVESLIDFKERQSKNHLERIDCRGKGLKQGNQLKPEWAGPELRWDWTGRLCD